MKKLAPSETFTYLDNIIPYIDPILLADIIRKNEMKIITSNSYRLIRFALWSRSLSEEVFW